MKSLTDFCTGNRCFSRHLFLPFFILLILLFISCTGRPKPYSILEFTGKGGVYNYSKSLYPVSYESDSIISAALYASKGDIIMYGEKNCFYYRGSAANSFSFKTTANAGFINEKINSICIPPDDDMIPWFKEMKSTDISTLGFIFFDSAVSESYIPYLAELAKTNPDIGIGYEGDLNDMDKILKIFKPGFIVGVNLPQNDFKLLSGLTNLEILSASLDDSIYTIPLPAMPGLKQLILTDINKNALLSNEFLVNNKQIERLTITQSGNYNFLILEPLNNLKELIINASDTIENFDLIRNHKQLELFSVSYKKLPNDLSLAELPDIRWITFYDNSTQDGFDSFIDFHPDLEVVEMINNDTIKNLQALLNLRKLNGLTITDPLMDFATVKSLKNLKYLSVPDKVLNDSIIKAELQKSLPDTRIVANLGVCLGSGWLLLIIPLILVFRVFIKQKSRELQEIL